MIDSYFPAGYEDIDDIADEEIEQAYLDWETSTDYQIEDLGVEL